MTSPTTTYEGTELNTGYTPKKEPMPPEFEAGEKGFEQDKWIFPKHWKQHQESADALQGTVDDLRESIAELEELKAKVMNG